MKERRMLGFLALAVCVLFLPPTLLAQKADKNTGKSDSLSAGTGSAKVEELLDLVQAQAGLIKQQGEQISRLQAELARLSAKLDRLDSQTSQSPTPTSPTPDPAQQIVALAPVGSPPQQAAPALPPKQERKEAPATKLPGWLSRTTFSGTSYFRYSREFEPGAKDANAFDFDRIYFIFRSQITDRVSLRFTMEAGEKRDGAGYFDVATKHFFIEVAKFPFASSRLAAGLADLPWVPYEEGIWGYRFQGKVFADREGYLTSTDLGFGWKVELPKKTGDFHLSVVNGEGWSKPEVGKYKDVHLRFTLTPFRSGWAKDVFFGAFGSTGAYDGIAAGRPDERQRVILQAGYRGKFVRLMSSYLWANDPASKMVARHPSLAALGNQLAHARGFSVFGVANLGIFSDKAGKWELMVRHDRLDPDRALVNNGHQRWIIGGSYRWNQYIQTLLDYERVWVDSGALRPFERRLLLQHEIRF